jgi:hypothetical protein
MSSTEARTGGDIGQKPRETHITVNDQPVVMARGRASGLQIKEAAISAGVPIQTDFVLSELWPNGEQKIIADDRDVEVKDGEQFWAIPGDDNS